MHAVDLGNRSVTKAIFQRSLELIGRHMGITIQANSSERALPSCGMINVRSYRLTFYAREGSTVFTFTRAESWVVLMVRLLQKVGEKVSGKKFL